MKSKHALICFNCGSRNSLAHGEIWQQRKKGRTAKWSHRPIKEHVVVKGTRWGLRRKTIVLNKKISWGYPKKEYVGVFCYFCAGQHREDRHNRKLGTKPIYSLPER